MYVESNITADTIWSSFNTYVLTDIIHVTGDATLTIEAGTTIKGEPKSAGAFDPGTLVITQGSKIEAVGTAEAPIIFTSTEDDGSLTEADSGLWGGVILLGKATINRPAGTEYIEGLPTSDLGIYGGTDDADNSGTLKYVSIRHGGAAIASDNEINGLTMGGVGSATTIEYVEVFANADDGFEWFGGTVNSKYLVGAFNNDDTFDWDEGFTGKGQFWFAIQAEGADRGAEMDGGPSSAPDAQPYSTPVIYNATFIGAGADGGSQVMKFRENTGGIYANSIFTGFEKGVDVDTGGKDGATIASGQDSEARFTAGDLALKANIYHDIAGASDIAGIVAIGDSDGANADFKSNFTSALTSAGSTFEDPQLAGISRVEGAALDPRPATDGPAYSGLTSLPADDVFYSSVSHKGAFGTVDWTGSWSKIGASYTGSILSLQILGKKSITLIVGETYSEKGAFARDHEGRSLSYYINKTGTVDTSTPGTYEITYTVSDPKGGTATVVRTIEVVPGGNTVQVEADIEEDTTWTRDNEYVLTDIIYVKNNATLTIEAGTTVKGEPKSAGAFDPGTLVITQGSKIEAVGTAEAPIIFTSTEDDGSLTEADSGLWGGVILLGKATINRPAGTEYIEGLPTSDLGIYGGTDDADNSGTLKYVSIRHGGAAIASDNEINGLTMGGVGSATTIEYVEVFANADDGFEWFGGTVNSKYLVGAFNNDDTFDWDEGFTGKGQFWFAIQAEGADRGAEMDGGPSSAPDAQPYSTPVIYNATFIGAGADGGSQVMKFRENTGGIYANSIFTGFEKGVDVDTGGKDGATIASGQDSEARFTAGDLALKANIYHDIAGASDIAGIVAIGDSDGANADFKSNFIAGLDTNNNTFEDPQLGGISRDIDGGLDPRPASDGPAYTGTLVDLPADTAFFKTVTHKGAFGWRNWAASWSKLGTSGALGYVADVRKPALANATKLGNNWYQDDALGVIHSTEDSEWMYQKELGYMYHHENTKWYYTSGTGLGHLYIDEEMVSSETVGETYTMKGYVYSNDLGAWVYLQSFESGSSVANFYYDTANSEWNIISSTN